MRCPALSLLLLITLTATTYADTDGEGGRKKRDDVDESDQVVLVNAANKLGFQGPVAKIKRVFDARGMLRELPDGFEAMFDGRNLQLQNVDAIRAAYANFEYDTAEKLIEDNEARILDHAASGDPLPALTELCQWRGLIAVGKEKSDEAVGWFAAAMRFDPTWTIDKKFAAGSVTKLIKRAKRESAESTDTGKLRVDVDPEDKSAMVQIDGGKKQPITDKIPLPVGHHLVVVSAEGLKTSAELVEIVPSKVTRLPMHLDQATRSDQAAKLVDATISAPPGTTRLKKTQKLSAYIGGAKLWVYVEDGGDDKVTLRVYDVGRKKVSKPVEIDVNMSSNTIQSKVMAALNPDNLIDPTGIMVIQEQRSTHWYERWYIWAGVAALAGGGYLTYHYATRAPTAVVGF
jgi:hypothetical protein